MPVQDLKTQIARLPEQPGVYLFANDQGETIYIGKARSLLGHQVKILTDGAFTKARTFSRASSRPCVASSASW